MADKIQVLFVKMSGLNRKGKNTGQFMFVGVTVHVAFNM